MKKLISLLIGLLVVNSILPLRSQEVIKNTTITGVCYAGTRVKRIYIPPPEKFYRKAGSKSGGSVTIIYSTGFSERSKPALEYAASILQTMLPADTKLTVLARWDIIKNSTILGQSHITGYVPGWQIDALNQKAFYPIALAEKIAGKSLNDLDGDIDLTINSSKQWYLGTDGQTPAGKYDLVTVVLHEICHGLGFYDSFYTDGTLGEYGTSGSIPLIYDNFIENFEGARLTDTSKFHNPSVAIRNQMIGGQLYFNGPLLKKFSILNTLPLSRARLWAPPVWDPGSSISHLDENVTADANALMTPFIDYGEAIHNPGKLTFSILGDLGWINTRIIHKPRRDTEENLPEIILSATVKSDTLYNRDSVGVVLSFDKFNTIDTVYLTSSNTNDSYSTTINIPSYNSELQYYFFVKDCFSRLYSPFLFDEFNKDGNPELFKYRYKVYIGADTVKPVILHTPTDYYMEKIDSISFKATVTDNMGIDTVYLEYKVNNGISKYIGLKARGSDSFSAILDARSLLLNGGDSIKYRIFATDSAIVANTSVLPKSGYLAIKIEAVSTTLESYSTDFTNAAADYVNIGFDISRPAGFSKFGLNTKHPYESPEVDGKSIDYTALLRHPLKLNESGMLINFRELVLVEPGDSGSVFGSPDFFDYVILEGSKNFGRTWFSLANGYDSRYNASWDSAYNSSVVDYNSTFVGTESMLEKHSIYLRASDNISIGDTFLLRFRLYSDPYSNGWGWVIEDLKINPLIDAVEKIKYDLVKVYPNPGNGHINISNAQSGNGNIKPLRYNIFNSAGICIIGGKTSESSGILADISGYPAGIYIIVLYRDEGKETIKYTLIK